MTKKKAGEYTGEQEYKLMRRMLRREFAKNESSPLLSSIGHMLVSTHAARVEAMEYRKASEEMGASEFVEWARANPLSPRASLHLAILQREADAPAIEHGQKFTQRKPGAKAAHTLEIERLVAENPGLPALELLKMATEPKAQDMTDRSFANAVSRARKSLK